MSALPSKWVEAMRRWANSDARITAVYVFGSRAKGTHRPDSDIDIAFTLSDEPDGNAFGYSDGMLARWRRRLRRSIPLRVHLQLAQSDDNIVWPAVLDHGVKVFER